uniref:Uncharacterized protein n=1 Tax=Arundo donax TaxID=35708 RepID=A0A0A9E514_ARUDO
MSFVLQVRFLLWVDNCNQSISINLLCSHLCWFADEEMNHSIVSLANISNQLVVLKLLTIIFKFLILQVTNILITTLCCKLSLEKLDIAALVHL